MKCRVASTVASVMVHLAERGAVWSEPVVQDDQAYAEHDWTFDQSKLGRTFARIRTTAGVHTLTLKIPQANALACIEHEVAVHDADAMAAILVAMGYRPTVRIRKRRRTARFGDITLCLDDVDNLGLFIEAEMMTAPDADAARTQGALRAWIEAFGLPITFTEDGYDTLMAAHLAAASA